jgi:hypothetical protein
VTYKSHPPTLANSNQLAEDCLLQFSITQRFCYGKNDSCALKSGHAVLVMGQTQQSWAAVERR